MYWDLLKVDLFLRLIIHDVVIYVIIESLSCFDNYYYYQFCYVSSHLLGTGKANYQYFEN